MLKYNLKKIVKAITNEGSGSMIKFSGLRLSITWIESHIITKSTTDFNHTFVFSFSHLKILSIDLYKNEQVGIFNNLGGLHPSLWNSSASPAEISCSSAVMRATISSTASGA